MTEGWAGLYLSKEEIVFGLPKPGKSRAQEEKRMEKQKTSLRTSHPGLLQARRHCHSESCGGTFSDKWTLLGGQGQPA